MAKTPTQLGAVAEYRPYAQAAGHKGLYDYVGSYDGQLGSTKAAFLNGRYLVLPGVTNNNATAPDSNALDIVGDIDIRVRVALDDWTPAAAQGLAAKYSTGQQSWRLRVDTSGVLRLVWSANGSVDIGSVVSTAATGVTDGAVKWVRATLDVDNGSTQHVVRFYLSDDGSTWTQLGNAVTTAGVTSIFAGTAQLDVGRNGSAGNEVTGKVYRTQIRSNILDDGTGIVFDADFTTAPAGATSFTESSSNAATVTINASSADTNDPTFDGNELDFATDDYVQIADASALNFGSAMTAFVVVKGAAQGSCVVGHWDTSSLRSWIINATVGGKVQALVSTDGTGANSKNYTSSLTAFDGTYHTVAITFGASTLKLFVDGVEDTAPTKTTDVAVASLFNSTASLTFGASLGGGSPTSFLTGSESAIALFPTALSASDIAQLHQHYKTTMAAESITLPAGPSTGGGSAILFSAYGFGSGY